MKPQTTDAEKWLLSLSNYERGRYDCWREITKKNLLKFGFGGSQEIIFSDGSKIVHYDTHQIEP